MAEIEFQSGKFQRFTALKTVHLGADIESYLMEGHSIEFDGETAKLSGKSYPLPQLKSAIKLGWLVKAKGGKVTAAVPKPVAAVEAPVSKYPREPDNEIVSSLGAAKVKRDAAFDASQKKLPQAQRPVKETVVEPERKGPSKAVDASVRRTKFAVEASPNDFAQVGVINFTNGKSAPTVDYVNKPGVKPTISPEELAELKNTGALPVKSVKKTAKKTPKKAPVTKKAAKIKEPEADIDLGLDEIEPPSKTKAAVEVKKKSKKVSVLLDAWDKTQPYQYRVKEAVQVYGSDPEAIEAICSVETPGVVAQIRRALEVKNV